MPDSVLEYHHPGPPRSHSRVGILSFALAGFALGQTAVGFLIVALDLNQQARPPVLAGVLLLTSALTALSAVVAGGIALLVSSKRRLFATLGLGLGLALLLLGLALLWHGSRR